MTKAKFAIKALPLLVAGLWGGNAMAAGFQLMEQNVSGLGNAYAGSAVVAEDASTIFFNPAGMALLNAGHAQLVVGVNAIGPNAKFRNSGSTNALGAPSGGDGGNAGDWAAVPNLYVAVPLSDRISIGLGIGAPFGLKTEYDASWQGRFLAVKSEVKTININPSISFKVNDQLALGAGVSYQRFDAELTKKANYFAAVASVAGVPTATALTAGAREGLVTVKGDDTGWGWNLGAIYKLSESTRLGLHYRSSIKYDVEGDVKFDGRPAAAVGASAAFAASTADGPVRLSLKLPDTATFSVYQKLSDQWDMVGDVSWTGWSKIQSLDFYRTNGTLLTTEPEHFRDTWRVAFGGNYKMSDSWKLRFGVAYDQTPVRDEVRSPRLPDEDRYWLSFGAQYRFTPSSVVDMGYTHVFVSKASINNNGGSANGNGLLSGSYDASVDILGVQYTHTF